jgi:hypothetical protein
MSLVSEVLARSPRALDEDRGDPSRNHASLGLKIKRALAAVALVSLAVIVLAYLAWPGIYDHDFGGPQLTGPTVMRLAAAFVLSFFPGYLFVRFVGRRVRAIWHEYVVNLHRLGVDQRQFLPEPPRESEYHRLWLADRQACGSPQYTAADNLYVEKYEGIYGRGSASGEVHWFDTIVPVLFATCAFAVGWTAVLADPNLYLDEEVGLPTVLAVAFAGAYLFDLQMLVRRYFQTDLKSGAYVTAFVRLVTVLITAAVLFALFAHGETTGWTAATIVAVAFTIGYFPVAGVAYVHHLVRRCLGRGVESLDSNYPLGQLDGMNLWYQTRLLEEGIEDMTDLVDANIVDVMLNTRVPVGRLVDWLDQAHLYLHLPPVDKDKPGQRSLGRIEREVLRQAGVINASTLLAAFGVYTPVEYDYSGGVHQTETPCALENRDPGRLAAWISDRVTVALRTGQPAPPKALPISDLIRVLANDTALTPILNWRQWGARRLKMLEHGEGDRDDTACHLHRRPFTPGHDGQAERAN